MKYLLATTGSIEKGVGFALFGPCHLLWLAATAVFAVGCCVGYRRLGPAGRMKMRRAIALAILADEALKWATLFIGGNYTVNYLPLHLCSINLFLIAWHAWRPSRTLDNYLHLTCGPGALAALLFPSWTALPLLNLMHIHSFTFHMLLLAYPLMLLVGGDIRPRLRELPKALALLMALAAIALAANTLLDTNFMFLESAPRGNPLQWFEKHLGDHLWGYAVLVPTLILVMYAPEIWHALRKHHRRRHIARA